jgi:hypothetical protein
LPRGWRAITPGDLQQTSEHDIVIAVGADRKLSLAYTLKPVSLVKGNCALVFGVDTEKNAPHPRAARAVESSLHEPGADAGAVKAMEDIDALDLDVVGTNVGNW